MDKHRIRIVVIVRCPLCGGWIVGNGYSLHLENVHLGAPGAASPGTDWGPAVERLRESNELADEPLETPDESAGWLDADAAGLLLYELGRRRQQGQNAALGFLLD